MKLTPHQKRILATLVALESEHFHAWWSREAIGSVVAAGGYHQVIQKRTMLALSELGLVLLEVESWPREVRELVSCVCAAYQWGLTEPGRALAMEIYDRTRWSAEARASIKDAGTWHRAKKEETCEGRTTRGERWKPPAILDFELDDDDDPAEDWKRS
jgi:hypothetical protein